MIGYLAGENVTRGNEKKYTNETSSRGQHVTSGLDCIHSISSSQRVVRLSSLAAYARLKEAAPAVDKRADGVLRVTVRRQQQVGPTKPLLGTI